MSGNTYLWTVTPLKTDLTFNASSNELYVDPEQIAPETLRALVQEFILRESSNDAIPMELEAVIDHALIRLRRRELLITFNADDESVGVIAADH